MALLPDPIMLLSKQAYQRIDHELSKFPEDRRQSAVLPALAIAQDELGWVPTEVVQELADYIGVPPVSVQEVVTFYDMYNAKPVGRYKITVCTNLPCALRQGVQAAEYLKQKLGIDFDDTTADGMFTLQEGECMGSCGDAPVMLVNDRVMCVQMSESRMDTMIEELKRKGESA